MTARKQRELFEAGAEPAPSSGPRARVIVEEPLGILDYAIPEALLPMVSRGTAVRVPLRQKKSRGYVVDLTETPLPEGIHLKSIESLDDERPSLPAPLLELVVFAADYYGVPAGEMLQAALPKVARRASERFFLSEIGERWLSTANAAPADDSLGRLLALTRLHRGLGVVAVERDLEVPPRQARALLRRAERDGLLVAGRQRHGPRSVTAFVRRGDPEALGARQKALRALWDSLGDDEVLASSIALGDRQAYAKLKKLESLGLLERRQVEVRLAPPAEPFLDEVMPTPTAEQETAIASILAAVDAGTFAPFLLQGVTGSGKTEVYLRVIAHALAQGKTALVLVPEIALTPQLGARFRQRFGDAVATFHSGLSVAERRDEWERVSTGQARVGLGARSAVFLPLDRLGIIVVDEEHETSYKQEETPRYNARDLAVVRARDVGAPVILGSATPSIESRHNSERSRYSRLVLPVRVASRPMPEVQLVDLCKEERIGGGVFTETLAQAVEDTLERNQQVILFLNRRGFAPYVFCRDCGHAFRCDACDVGLTLHRKRNLLLCHYCGTETDIPEECPGCHGLRLEAAGLGIEKVEEELRALFGGVGLARLDRDHIKTRRDLDRELSRFRSGEAPVLLGTQMVTKGHDFPGVTLVGVLAADGSLNFPDFRAAERTFQLLTQVAGRAGRGDLPGRVLVQAFEVEHYAVRSAATHDYEGFVAQELQSRRDAQYPPFVHLVLLRWESEDEGSARSEAEAVAQELTAAHPNVMVIGPAAAPLSRLHGRYRFHVLLKAVERRALREVTRALAGRRSHGKRPVRLIVDVDPYSML